MAQTQLEETAEGTEGTEFEGMSEDEIERALFNKEVEDDSDIDNPAEPEKEEVKEEIEEEPNKEDILKPEENVEDDQKPEKQEDPTGMEWLDDLPEDAQAKTKEFFGRSSATIARLEQRVKSHLGQLQPAQRAIAKLSGEVRELRGKLSEQQPPSIDIENRIKNFHDYLDEEYKEFPEEAAKLKARFSESLDGIPEVLQTATPQPQPTEMAGPDQSEEAMHLATAYSDWGERRFSPEFDQWIATQKPEVSAMLNSPYASDNIALLDAFTRDNPDWNAPQTPDQFHSLYQAQHSPLYRGWAQAEGINPDTNLAEVPDFQRDSILTRFKADLGVVLSEQEQDKEPVVSKLEERRKAQLRNRDPGSRRTAIRPGQEVDLDTKEGQEAYFNQLVASDPDLK